MTFQKRILTAARLSIGSLLATLTLVLGGCAGMQTGRDSEASVAVSGGYQGSETLAVLLPQSGRFAGAAKIVRDGIVAAQQADPQGKRPELRFYDSTTGSATALVQKAAADGASLVIGPLQKQAVNQLAGASALPVPVLALNMATSGGNPPGNLFQFSLSPEDEAASVARAAWDEGHRTAVMLYPEGNWGNRLSRAFRQEWKALGGQLSATQTFDPAAADFSATLSELSGRASGADFVFLVATSKLARQIWPQIRHKIGSDIPVYSTSNIYSGRFDPEGDRALVGLNFVEIPWLVEPAQSDPVASKGLYGQLPRLYAMGVDAYRLGSRLDWLSSSSQAKVQGKTGVLSMDSQRRIHRQLTLARIDADGPVKVAVTGNSGAAAIARVEPRDAQAPRMASLGSAGLASARP
jgi:outer membrane PBP1 activator LpoA protein